MLELGLDDALRTRDEDPDRAMSVVESSIDSLDLSDVELVRWIGQRCRPIVPDHLRPLFVRALDVEGEVRRIALQKLAATAWYQGRVEEAERTWTRAVHEGRAAKDDLWLMGLNNLGLIQLKQGRQFEALVLSGAVLRHGSDENPGVILFAHSFRARALLELDVDEAHRVLRAAFEFERDVDESVNECATTSLMSTRIDALAAAGRWEEVEAQIVGLVSRFEGELADAFRLTLRLKLLRARYELDPSSRGRLMEELDSLTSGLQVEGAWRESWDRARELLRWHHAVETGDVASAEREARAFLESCAAEYSSANLDEAIGLLERYPLPAPTQEELQSRIADLVLQRFSEGEETRDRVSESEEASTEDWRIFGRYQIRLLRRWTSLKAYFAARWKPGLPAYDRFAGGGLLNQCAWCGCVRSGREWVRTDDLTRLVSVDAVSHGICPRCIADVEG